MRQPDRVSVIIPTWNRLSLLKQCVASLLYQSWSNFEILVVDDASPTDPSSIFKDMPRVRVLRNIENRGQAHSRNRGIDESTGELLIFLDDDCRIEDPQWIEKHVQSHQEAPDLLVGGKIHNIAVTWAGKARACLTRHGIQFGGFLQTMNLSIRRETIHDIGRFDESLRELEDVDFSMRALQADKRLKYDDGLVIYHHYRDTFRSIISRSFQYGCWTIPVRKLRRRAGHAVLPGSLVLSLFYWLPLAFISSVVQTIRNLNRGPRIVLYYPWVFCYCLAHGAGFIAYYWRHSRQVRKPALS
jgi:GT2 family glycosyltransferase